MKSPDTIFSRWLHPFVFGAWMAALVYLLGSLRYMDFLRPEFGLLLVPAVFIAMGFLITCCAADALPLAVAVDTDRAKPFAKDQWVRVSGTFSLHQVDDKSFPLATDAALEPIEAPVIPYLF